MKIKFPDLPRIDVILDVNTQSRLYKTEACCEEMCLKIGLAVEAFLLTSALFPEKKKKEKL